jgi:hypothetical protein
MNGYSTWRFVYEVNVREDEMWVFGELVVGRSGGSSDNEES